MILEMIMDREKLDSLKVFWASAEERRGEGAGGGGQGAGWFAFKNLLFNFPFIQRQKNPVC